MSEQTEACFNCGGVGVIPKEDGPEVCWVCDGSGKYVATREPAAPSDGETPTLETLESVRQRIREIFSATHVDPEQISERMARDIVRAIHKGTDELLDDFARILPTLRAAIAATMKKP